MTDKEAMKLALFALESCGEDEWHSDDDFGMVQIYNETMVNKAITAIKEALAQPESECNPQDLCAGCRCKYAHVQPEQEPVAVKRMKEWVEFLKRQSDNGQHMNIPSSFGAGTCWELAIELEQFINTTPPQRNPLTDEQRQELMSKAWNKWLSNKDDGRLFAWDFSFEVEAAHGIKENT